jgi:serine protease
MKGPLVAAVLLVLLALCFCGAAANHILVLASRDVALEVADEHVVYRQSSDRLRRTMYVVDGHGQDNLNCLRRQQQRLGSAATLIIAEDSVVTLPIELPEIILDPLNGAGDVNLDYSNWHLDRISQRQLPLDRQGTRPEPEPVGTGQVHAYVVDTGVFNHADFPSAVQYDYNYFDGQPGEPANDPHGHGTHVAGILYSSTHGVAPSANIKVHSIKVLDRNGAGSVASLASGLMYILDYHVDPAVINLSLSMPGTNSVLTQLIAELQAAGVLIVAAAGNSGADACNYFPANQPGIVAVASVTRPADYTVLTETRNRWSNFGSCVDV